MFLAWPWNYTFTKDKTIPWSWCLVINVPFLIYVSVNCKLHKFFQTACECNFMLRCSLNIYENLFDCCPMLCSRIAGKLDHNAYNKCNIKSAKNHSMHWAPNNVLELYSASCAILSLIKAMAYFRLPTTLLWNCTYIICFFLHLETNFQQTFLTCFH